MDPETAARNIDGLNIVQKGMTGAGASEAQVKKIMYVNGTYYVVTAARGSSQTNLQKAFGAQVPFKDVTNATKNPAEVNAESGTVYALTPEAVGQILSVNANVLALSATPQTTQYWAVYNTATGRLMSNTIAADSQQALAFAIYGLGVKQPAELTFVPMKGERYYMNPRLGTQSGTSMTLAPGFEGNVNALWNKGVEAAAARSPSVTPVQDPLDGLSTNVEPTQSWHVYTPGRGEGAAPVFVGTISATSQRGFVEALQQRGFGDERWAKEVTLVPGFETTAPNAFNPANAQHAQVVKCEGGYETALGGVWSSSGNLFQQNARGVVFDFYSIDRGDRGSGTSPYTFSPTSSSNRQFNQTWVARNYTHTSDPAKNYVQLKNGDTGTVLLMSPAHWAEISSNPDLLNVLSNIKSARVPGGTMSTVRFSDMPDEGTIEFYDTALNRTVNVRYHYDGMNTGGFFVTGWDVL